MICEITFDLEVFKTKVLELVNESLESFKDFIKEKYSSRSGFHSFYPNDCEVWMTEYLTDENIDNGIVEGYLEFLQDDDMDSLIYEVIDKVQRMKERVIDERHLIYVDEVSGKVIYKEDFNWEKPTALQQAIINDNKTIITIKYFNLMETRVYLVPVSSEIFNKKTYPEISDEELMTTAEENGTVYSADDFQEKILTDSIDLSQYRFRIITITETVYALFGDEVANLYNRDGTLQEIADEINSGNCTYAVIDEGWNAYEILEFVDGWNGYATMTEEDYNELIKLLK